MNVLSLCDGMSCGHIALERANIKVDNYFASEIKNIAIKVTMNNYPDTIQIGDLNQIHYKNGILYTEKGKYEIKFDLVIFGSPCQTFSIAMKKENRVGLQNMEKSGLFFQCYRILNEVNPKYFMMENVASMKDEDRDFITKIIGVEPVMINSSDFSPQLRKRYYWTNIKIEEIKPKDIKFQSVLDEGYTERDKARCLTVTESRPLTTPVKMFHRHFSTGFWNLIFESKQHYIECVEEYIRVCGKKRGKAKDFDNYNGNIFDGVRYMNKNEMERCQTVPEGYTKCLTRNEAADVLGDGWTIDVIAHIFKRIGGK